MAPPNSDKRSHDHKVYTTVIRRPPNFCRSAGSSLSLMSLVYSITRADAPPYQHRAVFDYIIFQLPGTPALG